MFIHAKRLDIHRWAFSMQASNAFWWEEDGSTGDINSLHIFEIASNSESFHKSDSVYLSYEYHYTRFLMLFDRYYQMLKSFDNQNTLTSWYPPFFPPADRRKKDEKLCLVRLFLFVWVFVGREKERRRHTNLIR